MKQNSSRRVLICKTYSEAGISLIETMIALGLLLIAAAGIMSLATVAMSTTETQGHLAARTAEYAQDKMEQLLALPYKDVATDTTVFPAAVGGACPPACGLTPGGSLNPNAPVAGYSDYVDKSGNPVGAGLQWQYVRVWQITANAADTLKTISVVTQVRFAVGQSSLLPTSAVTSLKANPF